MKILKISVVTIFLSMSNCLFAGDLSFKSPHLTDVVKLFQKFSPELVEHGKVDVSYCGTYGASFSLRKILAKDFGEDFAVQPIGTFREGDLDFSALEFSEKVLRTVNDGISKIIYSNPSFGGYGHVLLLEKRENAYFAWQSGEMVIWDIETQEYLGLAGIMWQDDCD